MITTANKQLGTLVISSFGLLIIRLFYTSEGCYLFLVWNLFLAYLPYWFINRCIRATQPWKKQVYCLLSVLFLPNAPYIITDLFHLDNGNSLMPTWFDLVLICTFAITGLIYFILSLHGILFHLYHNFIFRRYIHVVKLALLAACAYGIYLGRYLRFNSWDVITNPLHLVKSIFISLFHPSHFKETWAITLTFTLFLFLIYELRQKQNNTI